MMCVKPAARAAAANRPLLATAVAAHSRAHAGGGNSRCRLCKASALESRTRAEGRNRDSAS